MSSDIESAGLRIPEFDTPDRLRKAREFAGLDQTELAARMGVSRGTISNTERGLVEPRRITLVAWSMATGVPVEWLETGKVPRPDGPDGGLEECAIRDSNPKPAAWEDTALTSSVARRAGTVSRFPVRPAAA